MNIIHKSNISFLVCIVVPGGTSDNNLDLTSQVLNLSQLFSCTRSTMCSDTCLIRTVRG